MRTAPDIRIASMRPDQARVVARLHAEGITQGFLSSLPAGVRESLYRGIARAPRSGVWVAVDDGGRVLGFLAGTADISRCYRSALARRGLEMVWYLAPLLVRRSTWVRAFESVTYPLRGRSTGARGQEDSVDQGAVTGELLSIAVHPDARGSGAALRLVEAFEDALQGWGYRGAYRVVTMRSDPRSNRFYQKAGFARVRDFEHHGVAMAMYHKELPA